MSEYIAFLEKKVKEAEENEKNLIESGRKDEANLEKIKNNVYGVCKTIYEVALKQTKTEEEKAAFFEKKITHLESTWMESYEKAKQFSDTEKILVEETKLAALNEAKEYFKK